MMKAMVYDRYGSLDVLSLREIAVPKIKADEVLVRARAAGIHIGDCFLMRGSPFPVRLVAGLLRPKYGVPGLDVAGTVEAVGSKVTTLKVGDEVFGSGWGTCAEYVAAKPGHLLLKPASLSFAEAAALPTSGTAALRGLRDAGKLQPGQKVLINGASGGVGTLAVQIAKALGGQVTGVCSTRNVALVQSLGADAVIDYSQEDFTKGSARYDLVLDNIENHSLAECRGVLTPNGTLILNSGTGETGMAMMGRLLKPLLLAPFVRHKLRRYVSATNQADLVTLTKLVVAGQLKPVLSKTYPLAETRAAFAYIESGRAQGKVVVTL